MLNQVGENLGYSAFIYVAIGAAYDWTGLQDAFIHLCHFCSCHVCYLCMFSQLIGVTSKSCKSDSCTTIEYEWVEGMAQQTMFCVIHSLYLVSFGT